MVQRPYDPGPATTTTGDELAIKLNDFWATFISTSSGAAAPSWANTGTLWYKTPATGDSTLMMRDRGVDHALIEFPAGKSPNLADTLSGVPIGVIMMWYGSTASIPTGYKLCNGATHTRTDGAGTIKTPDLRNRFIVGAGSSYAVNATGGQANGASHTSGPGGSHNHGGKTGSGGAHTHGSGTTSAHKLTLSQIPSHSHFIPHIDGETETYDPAASFSVSIARRSTTTFFGAKSKSEGGNGSHSHGISTSNTHTHSISTQGNHTHSYNSYHPYYYALCYIMRI